MKAYGSGCTDPHFLDLGTTWRSITFFNHMPKMCWVSAVSIATGYGLDRGVGIRIPVGSRIFSTPKRSDRFWGPPSLLSNAYRVFYPGVKMPVREADHSPPTSAEVKKAWIYIFTPPHMPSWRSAELVTGDNFTFLPKPKI
jgi:hypothetical protein